MIPGINDNVQNMEQRDYIALLSFPQEPAVDENAFSEEDLEIIIRNLQPGVNTIMRTVVKLIHQWISPLLLRIHNVCWRHSYFPEEKKKGILMILLKDRTGFISNPSNYRPIILLPTYGKIRERLMRIRIEREITPLHSEAHYGFVSGKSTTDAPLRYKKKIKQPTQTKPHDKELFHRSRSLSYSRKYHHKQ